MPKLNQRGAIQFIILAILITGLIAGLYLVQKTQIFKPKASVSGPVSPESSFTLVEVTQGPYAIGGTVGVAIYARSDITAANIFAAKLNFPTNLLEATVISHPTTPIIVDNYIEKYINNATGEVSIVGTKASPGFQTAVGGSYDALAVITFKVKGIGNATFSFTDESAIYSNSDNVNVLTVKRPLSIMIGGGVSAPIPPPSATPSPTPTITSSPTPAATPVPGTGDGNGDGKINLVDLSVLLSDFNKETGFRRGIDLNGDGKINTFDFSLMRNLLIQKGVIRG